MHLVLDEPDPSKRWKMTIAPVQFCHNVTVNGVSFTGQPVIPYLCDNSGSGCSVSGAGNGPGGGDCGCQHLKHSADGITWRTALNKTYAYAAMPLTLGCTEVPAISICGQGLVGRSLDRLLQRPQEEVRLVHPCVSISRDEA